MKALSQCNCAVLSGCKARVPRSRGDGKSSRLVSVAGNLCYHHYDDTCGSFYSEYKVIVIAHGLTVVCGHEITRLFMEEVAIN